MFKKLFNRDPKSRRALADARLLSESIRCVQCGICSFNCPLGIDVREHAWRGVAIVDQACLTCGECVARCPRGVLYFESAPETSIKP